MTKQEFDQRMERARELVIRGNDLRWLPSGRIFNPFPPGVCSCIEESFGSSSPARNSFEYHFKPFLDSIGYWLNDFHYSVHEDGMKKLERRLVFLESFKGFCEAYELYKEW